MRTARVRRFAMSGRSCNLDLPNSAPVQASRAADILEHHITLSGLSPSLAFARSTFVSLALCTRGREVHTRTAWEQGQQVEDRHPASCQRR